MAESIKATPEIAAAVVDYIDLRQQKKLIDTKLNEKKAFIEDFLGENENLLSEDGTKSLAKWSWGADKEVVDWEGIVEQLKKDYAVPATRINNLIKEHTLMMKGARTFRV